MGSGQLSRDKVGCDLCPHPNCHPDPGHHLPSSLPPLGVRWVIMVIILIQDHHLPFHLPPPSVRGRRGGGGGVEWTTVAASQATVGGKPPGHLQLHSPTQSSTVGRKNLKHSVRLWLSSPGLALIF